MVSKLLNYQSWKMRFEELERRFEGPPLYDTYPDEEEDTEPKDATSETEDSEKENDDIAGEYYGGDDEPKWDSDDEEPPLRESPEEERHIDEWSDEIHSDLVGMNEAQEAMNEAQEEIHSSKSETEKKIKRKIRNREKEEKMAGSDGDEKGEPPPTPLPPPMPPPSELDPTVTLMGAVSKAEDEGIILLTFKSISYENKKKERRGKIGIAKIGHLVDLMGQIQIPASWAHGGVKLEVYQYLLFTPTQITENEVSIRTTSRAEWTLKNMDLSFISMGQAQYLLIAPPQLTNTRRLLQEKNEVQKIVGLFLQATYVIVPTAVMHPTLQNQVLLMVALIEFHSHGHLCISLAKAFPCVLECKNTNTSSQPTAKSAWDQFINVSPLYSFINVEAMGRNANPITHLLEEFALYHGVAYSKNRAAAMLCFLLKNTVENRAFDPGGNFSVLYITQSSCFKLWNPLFSNYLPLQPYLGLSFTIEAFMAFLKFYRGDSVISMASIHYHKILGEPQEWSHRIPPLQSEFEFSKESIDLLYEWFMGFVGDLNGTIENKPLKLHDKEEENNADFAKSKRHKLMVEHTIQMVESTVTHKWDPGGLTRDGWNLSGTKRDEAIPEIPNIFVLENHENQFQQYFQAQVERNGQLNYEQGTCKLIFKALVICMTKLYLCGYHEYHSAVCKLLLSLHSIDLIVVQSWIYYAALKLGEDTWLVLFFEGGAVVIFVGKWNGVLRFELVHSGVLHSLISHGVIVLVLDAIPTYEGGAHSSEGLENLTQAWLPTRKEIWVEHLIQGLEYSKVAMAKRHDKQWDPGQLNCPITTTAYGYHWHVFFNFLDSLNCVFDRGRVSVSCTASCFKLWDPGELYSASCIIGTSCFQLGDPRGRPSCLLLSRHLHLEDKVNFEGGSIDENLGVAELGQTNRFGIVYSRRGKRVISTN